MNNERLKKKLHSGGYTCVAYTETDKETRPYYTSFSRGIVPLFELCNKNTAHQPLYAADKVIGKAAALLCAKCGVVHLYADVVSESALSVLAQYGVDVQYGQAVKYITDRAGTGKCPMEQLASGTDDPGEMFDRVKSFVQKMSQTQTK